VYSAGSRNSGISGVERHVVVVVAATRNDVSVSVGVRGFAAIDGGAGSGSAVCSPPVIGELVGQMMEDFYTARGHPLEPGVVQDVEEPPNAFRGEGMRPAAREALIRGRGQDLVSELTLRGRLTGEEGGSAAQR
jgi:hypothetical protein